METRRLNKHKEQKRVESIKTRNFIIKDNSVGNLINLGFQLKERSDDGDIYSYRFPIMKYMDITTLVCELTVFTDSHEVRIDVYDGINRPYPRFYYNEFGNADIILTEINTNILNKIKKMGITEKSINKRDNKKTAKRNNHGRNNDNNRPMRKVQVRRGQRVRETA